MSATNENINERESFEVIRPMIERAKSDIDDDSFYYLVWGWLVFAAALGHFFLMDRFAEFAWLPWAILMPLGGIATMIYGIRQEKRRKSRSHAEVFLKYPLIAFVVCLMIVLVSMNKLGLYTYPMVILVYGMWLFVSGGVIRFKPLLVGGIINWVLAIVSLSVGFSTQLLLLALAVLLGYIIPGHWLKMERNRIADPA